MNHNYDGSFAVGGAILFTLPNLLSNFLLQVDMTHWSIDLLLKIISTLVLGIVGGAAGIIGKRIIDKLTKQQQQPK